MPKNIVKVKRHLEKILRRVETAAEKIQAVGECQEFF